LQRRVVLQRVSSFEQYLNYLKQNTNGVQNLYRDILIDVTRFLRDSASLQQPVERRISAPARDAKNGCTHSQLGAGVLDGRRALLDSSSSRRLPLGTSWRHSNANSFRRSCSSRSSAMTLLSTKNTCASKRSN
jgi:hypothetical protein